MHDVDWLKVVDSRIQYSCHEYEKKLMNRLKLNIKTQLERVLFMFFLFFLFLAFQNIENKWKSLKTPKCNIYFSAVNLQPEMMCF